MCGIAGFSLSDSDNKRVNSRRLAKELLLAIELRGKDATGFAFPDRGGTIRVQKKDVRASHFLKHRLTLPRRTQTAILHTRAMTQGPQTENLNNHPIQTGPVVGVHNGWLYNDFSLFANVIEAPRIAEVDSEAVFALLAETDTIQALEQLDGPVACAWYDQRAPHGTLHLARGTYSPLVVGETNTGSLVFASTEHAVRSSCSVVGLQVTVIHDVEEGTILTVVAGRVVDVQSFVPYVHVPSSKAYMATFNGGTNRNRDKAIDEWLYVYADTVDNLEDMCLDLHADLSVGDWVQTVVQGRMAWCEVLDMPDTFPEGAYTLEAYLDDEIGPLVVCRRGDEFWSDPWVATTYEGAMK